MFLGEVAALTTALFWTFSSISFEYAGKRIGSLSVNLLRLLLAVVILTVINFFLTDGFQKVMVDPYSISLLLLSGLIGFVIGDLFLFQAFVEIGARVSMLIMALSPPMTALLGLIFLHESMPLLSVMGMTIVALGVVLVVTGRGETKRFQIKHSIRGLLFAFIGAFGQSLGLIFSKMGMKSYSPFLATEIRVIAGILGFAAIITYLKRWNEVKTGLKHKQAMLGVSTGSILGPVMGVTLSLVAVQNTHAGTASTLMSITPVLIIPISVIFFKEKVQFKEIAGALIAVGGVALMFI